MALHRLLYLAHSSESVHLQALYSGLSALAWRGTAEVVLHVYTDAPEAFARLGDHAQFQQLTPELLLEWRGPAGYVHRPKPAALRDLTGRFPGERLVLIDADTFFTGPVPTLFERIGDSDILMWEREYPVAHHDTMMMLRFRRRMRGCRFRGVPVELDCHMWNSGVVGIGPKLAPILDDWIAFLDEVFPKSRRWVLEQFALAWLAQRRGHPLLEAKDLVQHYYLQKTECVDAIRGFLARTAGASLENTLEELRRHPVSVPPLPFRTPRPPHVFQRIFGM
jgi:hypothetical protein